MLHARLAAIEAEPVSRGEPWLVPLILAALLAGLALLALAAGTPVAAIPLGIAAIAAALLGWVRRSPAQQAEAAAATAAPDFALVSAGLNLCHDPAVLTDGDGRLLSLNRSYRQRFPALPSPLELGLGEEAGAAIADAKALAFRDGEGCVAGLETDIGPLSVTVQRVGQGRDLLLWRFPRPRRANDGALGRSVCTGRRPGRRGGCRRAGDCRQSLVPSPDP